MNINFLYKLHLIIISIQMKIKYLMIFFVTIALYSCSGNSRDNNGSASDQTDTTLHKNMHHKR